MLFFYMLLSMQQPKPMDILLFLVVVAQIYHSKKVQELQQKTGHKKCEKF